MRTTQVEVIVFKIVNKEPLFLLLKRNPHRGGFWQPVSGGVEEGEIALDAVKREMLEETGISKFSKIIENVHYFEFDTEKYGKLKEYVFGVQVPAGTEPKLSYEHTEMKWCALDAALYLLQFDSNKTAIKKLAEILKLRE